MNRFERGLAVLGVAALFGLAVTDHFVCPLAAITGSPCPGCGMTRALLALTRGDWQEAWRQHPVAFALPPLAVGLSGFAFHRWRQLTANGRTVRGIELLPPSAPLWGGLCALLCVVWILRITRVAGEPPTIPHYGWAEPLHLRR